MKTNKRIAFICEGLSHEYGGQAISIPSLGNALEKNATKVSYFVTENKTSRILPINKSSKIIFCRAYGGRIKLSPSLLFSLIKYRKYFDVIHINNLWNFVPCIAFIFSFIYKKPYVVSTRGMAMEEVINNSKKKYLFFSLFLKAFLNKAKFIHITSEDEEDSLKKLHINNELIFAPNGINDLLKNNDFSELNKLRNKSKQILFVGKVCSHKNIDVLIKAFHLFSKQKQGWKLSIVGNLEDKKYLESTKKLIKDKNIEDMILLKGFKTGIHLINEYKKSSFFVSASRSENFGLSIAEALKSGLPCIVPKKSPWKNLSKYDCGFSSEPDEVEISKFMIKICKDYINNERVFSAAKKITKSYSWSAQAELLIQGYNK